jgi:hypothetical protein
LDADFQAERKDVPSNVIDIKEILMSAKKLVIGIVAALAISAGMMESASAGCNIYGCWPPVCQNVWIQTGPYANQGYWTVVCY